MLSTSGGTLSPWGPISAVLYELGNSENVQRIVQRAGLVVDWGLSPEQLFSNSTRIREYSNRISRAYLSLNSQDKWTFTLNIAKEVVRHDSNLEESLNEILSRIGWNFISGNLNRIDQLNVNDVQNLPEDSVVDLSKAIERLPNDLSGAITAACGAVESICKSIYEQNSELGDIRRASFQEKVNNSLTKIEAMPRFKQELINLEWSEEKSDELCHILKNAISNYAKVLEILRSNMGDPHGTEQVLPQLAYSSIKWSMTISAFLKS